MKLLRDSASNNKQLHRRSAFDCLQFQSSPILCRTVLSPRKAGEYSFERIAMSHKRSVVFRHNGRISIITSETDAARFSSVVLAEESER
jgi:hypothetical protein